jgi:hypothetical protein
MKKSIFITISILIAAFSAMAGDFTVGGISYNRLPDGKSVEVTAGTMNYSGDIVIPDQVTYGTASYAVTAIGEAAFSRCQALNSVTIGDNVTEIGDLAFQRCSALSSVKLGSSVAKIGFEAFYYCSNLASVELGPSATAIGASAFEYCRGLVSVVIGSGVAEIGEWAFRNCNSLNEFAVDAKNQNFASIDGVLLNKAATRLIDYPNAKAKYYALPASVDSIASQAFFNCFVLRAVSIPQGVEYIGSNAFSNCVNLKTVNCAANVPPTCIYNVFSGIDSLAVLYVPAGKYFDYSTDRYWGLFKYIVADLMDASAAPLRTGAAFSWQAVTGAAGYTLQISADADMTAVGTYEMADTHDATNPYIVSGLDENACYYYRLEAHNQAGIIQAKAMGVFTTGESSSGIATTVIDRQPVARTYYGFDGQLLADPQAGTPVISVTRYTDGSVKSEKLIFR